MFVLIVFETDHVEYLTNFTETREDEWKQTIYRCFSNTIIHVNMVRGTTK